MARFNFNSMNEAEKVAGHFGGFFGDSKRLSKDGRTLQAMATEKAATVYRFADGSWLTDDGVNYSAGRA